MNLECLKYHFVRKKVKCTCWGNIRIHIYEIKAGNIYKRKYSRPFDDTNDLQMAL